MKVILGVSFVVLFMPGTGAAGLGPMPFIVQAGYFDVYGFEGIDLNSVIMKLNYNYFTRLDYLYVSDPGYESPSILARTVDAIFSEVSDVLGIHMNSFHGQIRIVEDRAGIQKVFDEAIGGTFSERAFYMRRGNIIYISLADINVGVLAHEMAHALISVYFVIPPADKIQEILAGYVDFAVVQGRDPLSKRETKYLK